YACVAIGLCVRHMAWHIAPALDVRTCIKSISWHIALALDMH
ncbi:hypothetical protein EE612_001048, partial [Oryza sativa]